MTSGFCTCRRLRDSHKEQPLPATAGHRRAVAIGPPPPAHRRCSLRHGGDPAGTFRRRLLLEASSSLLLSLLVAQSSRCGAHSFDGQVKISSPTAADPRVSQVQLRFMFSMGQTSGRSPRRAAPVNVSLSSRTAAGRPARGYSFFSVQFGFAFFLALFF